MSTETRRGSSRLIKPAPLQPGSRIAVISPAGPSEVTRLEAGIATLASWGYSVKVGKHARDRHAFFSARDDERLRDLKRAFSDPAVSMVMCSRGGYGSSRLLDSVPYVAIAENPKLFVGFSDLTALNWALFARSRLVTFTGPLVNEIGDGLPEFTLRSFRDAIGPAKLAKGLWQGPLRAIRPGTASGRLFPGCLSIIVTLIGTPYLPDLNGAILLLEDVDEKPYHIDRMLVHLKNAGILDRISGLIVGRMVKCWPRSQRRANPPLEDILLELTASNAVPVFFDLPYGHHPERLTLPVGVRVEVSAEKGLRLLEDPLDRRPRP